MIHSEFYTPYTFSPCHRRVVKCHSDNVLETWESCCRGIRARALPSDGAPDCCFARPPIQTVCAVKFSLCLPGCYIGPLFIGPATAWGRSSTLPSFLSLFIRCNRREEYPQNCGASNEYRAKLLTAFLLSSSAVCCCCLCRGNPAGIVVSLLSVGYCGVCPVRCLEAAFHVRLVYDLHPRLSPRHKMKHLQ